MEQDTIFNGVERAGFSGVTPTHYSALEHLQAAVRCVKAHMSSAILHSYPQYARFSTVWNRRKEHDRMWEALKGPNRMHELWARAKAREDNIWHEDVDALCEELGDWYRDYRAETLQGICKLERALQRDAMRGLPDSCALPPGHPADGEGAGENQLLTDGQRAAGVVRPRGAGDRGRLGGDVMGEGGGSGWAFGQGLGGGGGAGVAGASAGEGSLAGLEGYYTGLDAAGAAGHGGEVEGDGQAREAREAARLQNAKVCGALATSVSYLQQPLQGPLEFPVCVCPVLSLADIRSPDPPGIIPTRTRAEAADGSAGERC